MGPLALADCAYMLDDLLCMRNEPSCSPRLRFRPVSVRRTERCANGDDDCDEDEMLSLKQTMNVTSLCVDLHATCNRKLLDVENPQYKYRSQRNAIQMTLHFLNDGQMVAYVLEPLRSVDSGRLH